MLHITKHITLPGLCVTALVCALAAFGCAPKKPDGAGGSGMNAQKQGAGKQGQALPANSQGATTDWPDAKEWLARSPLKENMRSMWVNCNIIAAAMTDPGNPGFDEMECSAAAITRKADTMIQLWSAVADATREIKDMGDKGNWDEMAAAHARLDTSCCNCHVETWAEARRFIPLARIKAWRKNQPFEDASEWVVPSAPPSQPATPFHAVMRMFDYNVDGIAAAINRHESLGDEAARIVAGATGFIDSWVQNQLALWRAVHDNADAIAIAARNRDAVPVREAYNAMTGTCASCHAQSLADTSSVPSPLQFPE